MNYSYTSLTNTNRQMFLKIKMKIIKYISESHKDDKLSPYLNIRVTYVPVLLDV